MNSCRRPVFKLPGVLVRREGKQVNFRQANTRQGESPLTYNVSGKDDEEQTAALIRSKIPAAAIQPRR